jgi:hypothetical protein
MKIQILDVYIPFGIPISPCDLALNLISEGEKYNVKFYPELEELIKISESCLELQLFFKNDLISQDTQDLSFLKGDLFEILDEWVSFKILPNKHLELPKVKDKLLEQDIKIRLSGLIYGLNEDLNPINDYKIESPLLCIQNPIPEVGSNYIKCESRFSTIQYKPLEASEFDTNPTPGISKIYPPDPVGQKTDTSCLHDPIPEIADTSFQTTLLQSFSPCEYLNNIYNIEEVLKSVEWKLKDPKFESLMHDIEDTGNTIRPNVLKIPGNPLVHLNKFIKTSEVNSLAMTIMGLCAKKQWASINNQEIRAIRAVSDLQAAGCDDIETSRRLSKQDKIKDLESIDNILTELDNDIENLYELLNAKKKNNLDLQNHKKNLEEEYKTLAQLNQIKKDKACQNPDGPYENLRITLEKSISARTQMSKNTEILHKNYLKFIESTEKTQKNLQYKQKCLIQEFETLQNEINELKRKNSLLASKILKNSILQSGIQYKQSSSLEKNIESKVQALDTKKEEINTETVLLIEKLKQNIKTQKIRNSMIEKKTDEKITYYKRISGQLSPLNRKTQQFIKPKDHSKLCQYPILNAMYALQDFISYEYNYNIDTNLMLSMSFNQLSKYKLKIEAIIKQIYSKPEVLQIDDKIDAALKHYLSVRKPKLASIFIKQSNGVYFFGTRVIQLKLDTDKLLIKAGNSFLPIEDFLKLNKRPRPGISPYNKLI